MRSQRVVQVQFSLLKCVWCALELEQKPFCGPRWAGVDFHDVGPVEALRDGQFAKNLAFGGGQYHTKAAFWCEQPRNAG